MSRSPQIKMTRWSKTDLVNPDNVLETYDLASDAAWWHAISGGACGCVSVSMRPPRRDEFSGAPHWPVRRDDLTGQGAFAYAGTMLDA